MKSSERNTHAEWKVVEVVGAAITIVTGIAAIIAMRDKTLIVMAGVLGGIVLGAIAWQAFRQNNRDIGKTVAIVAAVVLLATTVYGVFIDTSEAEADPRIPPTTTSSESAPQTRPKSTLSTPTNEAPVFRGSAKLAAGQAVDLETANPEPKRTSSLDPPADVFIDSLLSSTTKEAIFFYIVAIPATEKRDAGNFSKKVQLVHR
jgi:hypothetical protein